MTIWSQEKNLWKWEKEKREGEGGEEYELEKKVIKGGEKRKKQK